MVDHFSKRKNHSMNQTSTFASTNNKENIKENATPTNIVPSLNIIRKDGNIIKPRSILTKRPSRIRDNCDDVTPLGGVLATLSLRPLHQKSINKKVSDNNGDEISESSSDSHSHSNESSESSGNSNSDCSVSSSNNSETTESIQSSYYKSIYQSNDTNKSDKGRSIEEPLHSTTTKLFPIVNNNGANNDEKEKATSSTTTSTSTNKKRKSNIFASPKPVEDYSLADLSLFQLFRNALLSQNVSEILSLIKSTIISEIYFIGLTS